MTESKLEFKARKVFCGECGEQIDRQVVNAAYLNTSDGMYFQFHARDAMDVHVQESGVKHTGSTSKIRFDPWESE